MRRLAIRAITCVLMSVAVMGSAVAAKRDVPVPNLSHEQIAQVVERFSGRPFENFNAFAFEVYTNGRRFLDREQQFAIGDFAANKRLSATERLVIHRLLGIYTRLKYGGESRRLLAKLVALQTVPSRPEGKEAAKDMAELLRSTARAYGLKAKVYGFGIVEITGKSGKGETIDVHLQATVDDADGWQLKNGQTLNPFTLSQQGERLYGRGVHFNKNSIVMSLMALRMAEEEGVRLHNRLRLVIDTGTVSREAALIRYYKKRPLAGHNLVLAGSFPSLMYPASTDPKANWIQSLLGISVQQWNMEGQEAVQSADNPLLKLPNAIQFGASTDLSRPSKKTSMEFKSFDHLLLELQTITEMFLRLGQSKTLSD